VVEETLGAEAEVSAVVEITEGVADNEAVSATAIRVAEGAAVRAGAVADIRVRTAVDRAVVAADEAVEGAEVSFNAITTTHQTEETPTTTNSNGPRAKDVAAAVVIAEEAVVITAAEEGITRIITTNTTGVAVEVDVTSTARPPSKGSPKPNDSTTMHLTRC